MIANGHFHKGWERFVKTWFNQPAKKLKRQKARRVKAAKVFPRPVGLLRPLVRCPASRYHSRQRLGRGFTVEELRQAGIGKKNALKIGVSIDYRRNNLSVEALKENVQRLKDYKSKLVVLPSKPNALKKTKNAKGKTVALKERTRRDRAKINKYRRLQFRLDSSKQVKKAVSPVEKKAETREFARVTKFDRTSRNGAHYALREAHSQNRLFSAIKKKAKRAAERKEKAAAKKK